MDIKEIIDETGWSLIEILKRLNSLPYVTEKITEDSLSNMTKEEFMEFLLGRTWEDIND
ncbi:hypothetical protein [Staphylococcus agnetis]|uniref:hypothetical protein n=1 Tax=Staphylococcus agnetis TaxID=985762 RepID=UPI000A67E194|nr:hypothetical protein [Staphylococcus agnetis]MCO4357274.1 hypothetical protein [Staphylococcus agnetis]MCO4363256.1 hypothetical protein [Staphylococcus agnetis]NJH87364.1 hypothetical protein [Staphylococcus agnetis]NJH98359.1 hypothetical protein [Staphylococcus agnetis]NJH98823.1 hypothetical protein [Staphylococcus agnetis]